MLQPLAENGWQPRQAADGLGRAAVYDSETVTLRADPRVLGSRGALVVTALPVYLYDDTSAVELTVEIHSRVEELVIDTGRIEALRKDNGTALSFAVRCSRSTLDRGKIVPMDLPCRPARLNARETMRLHLRFNEPANELLGGTVRFANAFAQSASAVPDLKFEIRATTGLHGMARAIPDTDDFRG
jgi:hypothetical protein